MKTISRSALGILLTSTVVLGPLAAEPSGSAVAGVLPTVSAAQLAVREGLILAGELQRDALEVLAGSGAVIVDLTEGGDSTERGRARAAALGLEYHNLPVYGATIDPEQLRQLAALVGDRRDLPLIVHCVTGNRAAMVWAALELDRGEPLQSVLAAVEPLVTREPIRAAIEAYAAVPTGSD